MVWQGLLQTQWRVYRANLLRHEEGHVMIALRAAYAVDKYLGTCGGSSSLEKLKGDIQKNTRLLLKQYRKIDRGYDQRTRHGATQGATLAKAREADQLTPALPGSPGRGRR